MQIAARETSCRSLLNRTGLPAEWCANPYTGCAHACRYCYARFMKKYTGHREPWGHFVDAKVNAPAVLAEEIRRRRPGRIQLSSVTDPYQPLEARYRLTRAILEALVGSAFTVTIQTKSDLVLRDLDILRSIRDAGPGPDSVRVGFSITCLDETARSAFEPGAAPAEKRLRALETIKKSGLATFAMIAPVLPGLTDTGAIRARLDGLADTVIEDRLNIRYGNHAPVMETVRRHFPHLAGRYTRLA